MTPKQETIKYNKDTEYVKDTIEELAEMTDQDYEDEEIEEDEYIDTRSNDEDCTWRRLEI